jgi:hypothetical protein
MNRDSQKLLSKALVLALVIVLSMFAARRAEAENVLKLASLAPLRIKEGLEMKKWHDLFAKMINEQGGWTINGKKYRVDFQTYDSGIYDPAKTLAAVQKAIFQDGVKILVDNFMDIPSVTAVNADQNKVLTLGVGFTDDVVSPKYHYFFRPQGGFFTGGTNYLIARDFYKQGARTSVVATVDTQDGHVVAARYGEAEQLAGMKIHPPIFFGMETVDFGPIATKIKSLNPGMVDFGMSSGEQVVNLTSALKDAGWKGFIFPGAGINSNTLANIVGRVGAYFDGTEMLYFDPRGIPSVSQNPEMRALMERYIKEYGEFQTEGCLWVKGWFILKDAINATQSIEPAVLMKYLESGPKPSMTMAGFAELFARPDLNQLRTVDGAPGANRGVIKNGKLTYLGPIAVKEQYLVTIKVNNLADAYQKYWDQHGRPKFPDEPSTLDYSDLFK